MSLESSGMNKKDQGVVLAGAGRLSVTAVLSGVLYWMDCLVLASGVAGPGAMLVKRKEKPSRRKTMLWMLVGWELFPLPSRSQVNFSLSISALRSDGTLQSFASLLLSS